MEEKGSYDQSNIKIIFRYFFGLKIIVSLDSHFTRIFMYFCWISTKNSVDIRGLGYIVSTQRDWMIKFTHIMLQNYVIIIYTYYVFMMKSCCAIHHSRASDTAQIVKCECCIYIIRLLFCMMGTLKNCSSDIQFFGEIIVN